MPDLDLVPADYRQSLALRRWSKRVVWSAALLLFAMGGARVALARGIVRAEAEFQTRRAAETNVRNQRLRVERLEAERRRLDQRRHLLAGLRGGIAARQLFVSLDRSLDEEIAFREWNFLRAGEWVEETQEAVPTGYFLVVPSSGEEEAERAWKMETHLEVRGTAVDHGALARFVRRLVDQPEVQEARVLNTHTEPSAHVGFELAVVVRSRGRR